MDRKLSASIKSLIYILEKNSKFNFKALIGFDGFIIEHLNAVKSGNNLNDYTKIHSLKEFNILAVQSALSGVSLELVPIKFNPGGNGPAMSSSLTSYGFDLTYIGPLGLPNIHPAFKELSNHCEIFSLGEPAVQEIINFSNEKLYITKNESLRKINWKLLKEKIDINKLILLFESSSIIGLTNWSMIPEMNNIFQGIIHEIIPYISSKERIAFFNLGEINNCSKNNLTEAIKLLKEFSTKYKIILGLEKKAAYELANILKLNTSHYFHLKELALSISTLLDLDYITIHDEKECIAVYNKEYYHSYCPYINKAVYPTDSNDNFYAGFCLGVLLKLPVHLCLVLASASYAYYAKTKKNPTVKELIDFLHHWKR